jgi:hypothetical protein
MPNDDKYSTPDLISELLLIIGCAVVYFLFLKLNDYLFSAYEFAPGVNWISLPGGLGMLLVMVLFNAGVIGIAAATGVITYMNGPSDEYLFSLLTGAVAGLAPLMARQISVELFKLDGNLRNLTLAILLKVSVVFSVMTALLQQVWYFWNDRSENFVVNSAVKAVGDLVGTVIILATSMLLIKLYKMVRVRR